MWEKSGRLLKEKWWLLVALVVLLSLTLIPTREGLPGSDYKGCEIEGTSCYHSTIKSITKESDGSATIVVPIKSEEKNVDLDLHLTKHRTNWLVGNTVFMNLPAEGNKMYVFIGYRSNLLATLFWKALDAHSGATAVINIDTREEIED